MRIVSKLLMFVLGQSLKFSRSLKILKVRGAQPKIEDDRSSKHCIHVFCLAGEIEGGKILILHGAAGAQTQFLTHSKTFQKVHNMALSWAKVQGFCLSLVITCLKGSGFAQPAPVMERMGSLICDFKLNAACDVTDEQSRPRQPTRQEC